MKQSSTDLTEQERALAESATFVGIDQGAKSVHAMQLSRTDGSTVIINKRNYAHEIAQSVDMKKEMRELVHLLIDNIVGRLPNILVQRMLNDDLKLNVDPSTQRDLFILKLRKNIGRPFGLRKALAVTVIESALRKCAEDCLFLMLEDLK